jgi:hypothetical protein
MIFPSEVRGMHNRTQPAKGCETESECKLRSGVRKGVLKQNGIKQRV